MCIIASAIFRRIPLNGIRSMTPSCGTLTRVASGVSGALGVAAGSAMTGAGTGVGIAQCDSTSEAVTRPPRPVGVTLLISTFMSFAIFRTAGVALALFKEITSSPFDVRANPSGIPRVSSPKPTTQSASFGMHLFEEYSQEFPQLHNLQVYYQQE